MRFFQILQIILLSLPTLSFGQSYQAPGEGGSIGEYLDFISQVNHFSPSEGAGSHGSYGIKVGVGMQLTPRNDETTVAGSGLNLLNKKESLGDALSPRITLSKGLFVPVNLGISFAILDDPDIHQWAGYAQWTIFELLGWPAMAGRYNISKISGLDNTELLTQSLEAVLSYGFLRYFNVYVSSKILQHDVTIYSEKGSKSDTWTNYGQGGGIEIMVLPPFTSISLEVQKVDNEYKSYYGKLSYLL